MLSSWQDWRPEDDLAWFILDAVAQMNLSAIYRTARADGWGAAGAEPADPERRVATPKDWTQRTRRGRTLSRTRSQTVEPVFGQIKSGRGGDRLMRRGQSACASEWNLLGATHTLLKLWRHRVCRGAPMVVCPPPDRRADPAIRGHQRGPGAGLTARRTLAGYEGWRSSVPYHVPVRPDNRV